MTKKATSEPAQDTYSTSGLSTNISMEAPLSRCFQYKHCHGYLLIKTNAVLLVCFPRVTMQASQNKRFWMHSNSRCCLWTYNHCMHPTATRPWEGAVQMSERSRPEPAHFRWLWHSKWAEPDLQMKDGSRSPVSSPFKRWPKAISLSILTVIANCFGFSQVGPCSLSLQEVHWGLFVVKKNKKF